MRLYQLEYFIKIAECGSITKAAQELYLSQPSLTKAISSLESEYDLKLFSRTARGISLTPRGKDFLEYARSVVESSHALENTFGKKDKPLVQRIAIVSQQLDFVYDVLLTLYQENSAQAIQIDLRESDRGEIVRMVEDHRADIGLLVLSERDSKAFKSELRTKNLEMHTLDRSKVYASIGRLSSLYGHDEINTDEAKQQFQLILDTEQTMRRELIYKKEYIAYSNERLIFCNTIGVCRKFLEETDALLLTPKWVLGYFKDTGIRSVPLVMKGGKTPLENRLVWIKRTGEEFRPLEEKFMKLLESHFQGAS